MPEELPSTADKAILYDRELYLKYLHGCRSLGQFVGTNPPLRFLAAFRKGAPQRGERVLDLGCGRGELTLYAASQGLRAVGVDFSPDAIAIAEELQARARPECRSARFLLTQDWSREIEPASFDVIYCLDVVEHLDPQEVDALLAAAYEKLRPGGRIVLHTSPNRFVGSLVQATVRNRFLRATVFKLYARLVGIESLNANIAAVHVNEQSVGSLKATMARTRFQCRVWCEHLISWRELLDPATVIRKMLFFGWPLTALWPLNRLFANDIWAVGKKVDRAHG